MSTSFQKGSFASWLRWDFLGHDLFDIIFVDFRLVTKVSHLPQSLCEKEICLQSPIVHLSKRRFY